MGTTIVQRLKSPRFQKWALFFLCMAVMFAPELFATGGVGGQITTKSDTNVEGALGTGVWAVQWFCWFGGALVVLGGIYTFWDGKQKQGIIMILFGALVGLKLFSWMEPYIPKAGKVGGVPAKEQQK